MKSKKTISVLVAILFMCFSFIKAADNNNIESLCELISKGNITQVKDYLDKYPDLVNKPLGNGDYVLHHAITSGNAVIVQTLILDYNASVNIEGSYRTTPIIWAVRQNKPDIVKLLINNGADVNSKDMWWINSLIWATWNNSFEIAQLLVESGANVNLVDEEYRTPLMYAAINNRPDFVNLLLKNNADINTADKTNKTAFSWAVTQNNIEIANLLLENHAEMNIADSDGWTPLMLAVRLGNTELVNKLLEKGALTNPVSKNGNQNVLHIASIFGFTDITERLLQKETNLNKADAFGMTPVMYAAKYGHQNLFKCFKQDKGKADINDTNFGFCSNMNVSSESARVWYTGHSGWIVNTQNHILVFDYYINKAMPAEPLLANGHLNSDEIKGKKVILFASHEHSDHFDDQTIKILANEIKDLTLICGFKPEDSQRFKENGYNGPQYQYIGQREVKQIGDMKVVTLKSIDTGVGFYVEIDGVSIFHAGDHANLNNDIKQNYTDEIDFIAKNSNGVDIAFLPVTGCSQWQKEPVIEGFFTALNKLNCQVVFPMHGGDSEYTYQEFVQLGKEKKSTARIIAVQNPGDGYSYNKQEQK